MASCKDCLHYYMCADSAEKFIEVFTASLSIRDACSNFKDHKKFVEVVRCKDCKWYAPNNEGSWIGCAFDTRHPDDVPKADDFCSYGERKENG